MAELARDTQEVTPPRFMKLTEEFINQEELIETLLKAQTLEEQARQEGKKASTAPKPKEEKNPRKGEKKSGPLSIKSEPRKTKIPRFQQEVFTPLNANFTEVFMAIKGDLAFRWPPKMRLDSYKWNHSRFCEYHGEHGHSTKDCMVLYREIENFVKNGKLVRFLTQEWIRKANLQGPLPLEGNREGPRAMELRHRDPALRGGQYGN